MSAPDSILQLVENFETHRRAYLASDYNEAQVRLEFIDPFFEALGWILKRYKEKKPKGPLSLRSSTPTASRIIRRKSSICLCMSRQ